MEKNLLDHISTFLSTRKMLFLKQIVTGSEKWIHYNNVEKKRWGRQGKWTTTNHTPKASLHPKNVMCVWWDLKRVLLRVPSRKSNDSFQQVLLPVRTIKSRTWRKASRIIQQSTYNLNVSWWPGKNCYILAGKFWFICCIHQTWHLWVSIYFSLYKIFLMEKLSIP